MDFLMIVYFSILWFGMTPHFCFIIFLNFIYIIVGWMSMPCHPCGDEKTLLGWVSPYFLGSWNWIISHPAGVTNTFILWVIWLAPTPYVFFNMHFFPVFQLLAPKEKIYWDWKHSDSPFGNKAGHFCKYSSSQTQLHKCYLQIPL